MLRVAARVPVGWVRGRPALRLREGHGAGGFVHLDDEPRAGARLHGAIRGPDGALHPDVESARGRGVRQRHDARGDAAGRELPESAGTGAPELDADGVANRLDRRVHRQLHGVLEGALAAPDGQHGLAVDHLDAVDLAARQVESPGDGSVGVRQGVGERVARSLRARHDHGNRVDLARRVGLLLDQGERGVLEQKHLGDLLAVVEFLADRVESGEIVGGSHPVIRARSTPGGGALKVG